MLSTVIPGLNAHSVVLASGSPRRKELLEKIGLAFSVVPSTFAEDLDKATYAGRPAAYVADNARLKAQEVFQRANQANLMLIACDTVVYFGARIFEKPKDPEEAVQTLKLLSGQAHEVYTGVTLLSRRPEQEPLLSNFHVRTGVQFGTLEESLIRAYVATGEPLDKAGAYGLQGIGAILVEGLDGDYFNVELIRTEESKVTPENFISQLGGCLGIFFGSRHAMLSTVIPGLSARSVVLASGSPRRKELLEKIGLAFSVVPSTFAEDLDKAIYAGRPAAYVADNARLKAEEVLRRTPQANLTLIACDTVVYFGARIFEKPKDPEEAVQTLKLLSGQAHEVYTGVTLLSRRPEQEPLLSNFHVRTGVQFGTLEESLIRAYVATGEPL